MKCQPIHGAPNTQMHKGACTHPMGEELLPAAMSADALEPRGLQIPFIRYYKQAWCCDLPNVTAGRRVERRGHPAAGPDTSAPSGFAPILARDASKALSSSLSTESPHQGTDYTS